jgi:hypothetical protein
VICPLFCSFLVAASPVHTRQPPCRNRAGNVITCPRGLIIAGFVTFLALTKADGQKDQPTRRPQLDEAG